MTLFVDAHNTSLTHTPIYTPPKPQQTTAAGLVPRLQRAFHRPVHTTPTTTSPTSSNQQQLLKEVALTMLCDLAHHPSPAVREELWCWDCGAFYLGRLAEAYWQARVSKRAKRERRTGALFD